MKYSTHVERDFLRIGENLYREVVKHYLVQIDQNGKHSRFLQKEIPGGLFEENNQKMSSSGVYIHTFPDDGLTRRLVAKSL